MKDITDQEMKVVINEMALRVKEFMGIHAEEKIRQMVEPVKDTVFEDDSSVNEVSLKLNMVFATSDLRDILKDQRAGRIRPLQMPDDADEPVFYE